MMYWGKFSNLESVAQARDLIIDVYGPTCEIPFAYFLPEYEGQNEAISILGEKKKKIYFTKIKSEVLELRAANKMLKSIEGHYWIYDLGFVAGKDTGRLVSPSAEWHAERIPWPSSWFILGRKLGVLASQESLEELILDILKSPLLSDFEQGINWVFTPEDITGSGSDAMDPEGRERLKAYFGLAKFCENLNQKLVNYFDLIRKLSPQK